jgi:glycosyltransferase involved in cell wall biosynthesis
MRLAAPYFAQQFCADPAKLDEVERILCSPFLDVAVFKGLLPEKLQNIPVFTYYHENQFTYPVQVEDPRDIHFALTNLTTALASERLAFNSRYNFQAFLQGAESLLRKIHDMDLSDWQAKIEAKSTILPPGLDFTELDSIPSTKGNPVPVILWNHRWEHDKDPDLFFQTLGKLEAEGHEFKIIILGQSFRQVPEIFTRAQKQFSQKIIRFGYVSSPQEYLAYLKQADIVVSTAKHEFYGIAVIEAVRAGCRPLLPRALAYPELFPEKYLYKKGELPAKLADLLKEVDFPESLGVKLTERFSWTSLLPLYKKWLNDDGLRSLV